MLGAQKTRQPFEVGGRFLEKTFIRIAHGAKPAIALFEKQYLFSSGTCAVP